MNKKPLEINLKSKRPSMMEQKYQTVKADTNFKNRFGTQVTKRGPTISPTPKRPNSTRQKSPTFRAAKMSVQQPARATIQTTQLNLMGSPGGMHKRYGSTGRASTFKTARSSSPSILQKGKPTSKTRLSRNDTILQDLTKSLKVNNL